MTLRLDEHYVSVQGEGPRVGTPTQFVRFGGCNLRCPGWPCDTQHAIDPQYRKQWKTTSHDEIVKRAKAYRESTGATNICLTGGEPFLQREDDLQNLFYTLRHEDFSVECFSNGTLLYPQWAAGISFTMDWKLRGSGEGDIGHANRWANLHLLNDISHAPAVKFVLKDEDDLTEAVSVYQICLDENLNALRFYYGRVWDARWTDAEMVQHVLERQLPWKLNMQVHNYIWDRNQRGI